MRCGEWRCRPQAFSPAPGCGCLSMRRGAVQQYKPQAPCLAATRCSRCKRRWSLRAPSPSAIRYNMSSRRWRTNRYTARSWASRRSPPPQAMSTLRSPSQRICRHSGNDGVGDIWNFKTGFSLKYTSTHADHKCTRENLPILNNNLHWHMDTHAHSDTGRYDEKA